MLIIVFGTRPELIKVAPIIHEARKQGVEHKIINTGQHKEMLVPLLQWFDIKADYDLSIMKKNQTLNDIIHNSISELDRIYKIEKPKVVIVQGDTTTAFIAALAAFYSNVKIAHVEAGLRTETLYNPFPEEANRRLISQIATYHFTPSSKNSQNLLDSGIKQNKIFEIGNTVIDALLFTRDKTRNQSYLPEELLNKTQKYSRIITVTGHRRENLGDGFYNIFSAIAEVAKSYNDCCFVYPVHLNPKIKEASQEILGNLENVFLVEPLDYPVFVELMSKSYMIISDSGGVQEEAPSLNIPVLVTRTNTERGEVLEIGAIKLVGTEKENIARNIKLLLDDSSVYDSMINKENPYGQGHSAEQIINTIKIHV